MGGCISLKSDFKTVLEKIQFFFIISKLFDNNNSYALSTRSRKCANTCIILGQAPGPKLGNAGPPRNHLSGPPKIFFLDGDAKERAPKGRCQATGVWGGMPHPENFAKFHLILEAFCAFGAFKIPQF